MSATLALPNVDQAQKRRLLTGAIAVSVALHAFLLWSVQFRKNNPPATAAVAGQPFRLTFQPRLAVIPLTTVSPNSAQPLPAHHRAMAVLPHRPGKVNSPAISVAQPATSASTPLAAEPAQPLTLDGLRQQLHSRNEPQTSQRTAIANLNPASPGVMARGGQVLPGFAAALAPAQAKEERLGDGTIRTTTQSGTTYCMKPPPISQPGGQPQFRVAQTCD